MCSELGDPIDSKKMPPEMEDFPSYVEVAISIFNCLPDTYSGGMEPIYCGKDIGAIQSLYEIFEVDKEDKLRILKVVNFLDTRARKQAIADAKRKSKSSGGAKTK